jgi:Gas vesicle synthesis protein GvpL/GvpF
MSPVYVYALVDVPITLDLTGVMNEPLVLIPAAAGWLVVGERQAQVSATTAENLRAQDTIVRVLATRATGVLPMRFGTCFENKAALQNRMARFTAERLRTALARVRGGEQMTLRLFQPEAPALSPRSGAAAENPGTAYLEQRAAALTTSLPELLEPLRRALAQIVRAEIVDATKRPPLIGSIYHLIARGDADRYREALAAAQTPASITIRATGPSPAYAFAKDALP